MREIRISRREEGQRLIRILSRYLPVASSGFLHKMLRKKNIKLNEAKATGSEIVKEGDRICIYFSEETMKRFTSEDQAGDGHSSGDDFRDGSRHGSGDGSGEFRGGKTALSQGPRKGIRILWENEDLLILHKPAGILSQKAKKEDDSLNDWLLDYCMEEIGLSRESLAWFRPSIVNRLDRNTSGIVLAGLTAAGLKLASQLLREREMEKYYLAPVFGIPDQEGEIRGYLTKDSRGNRVRLDDHKKGDGKEIRTGYTRLASSREPFPASLMRIRLYTGKSHQIRAHLASLGHPVLGDGKYGNKEVNAWLGKKFGVKSQLLHSYEIRIPEDLTRRMERDKKNYSDHEYALMESLEGLIIKDPVPENMNRVLKNLKLIDF